MKETNTFVVYDRNVEQYARKVACDLGGGEAVPMLALTADEEHKTVGTAVDICRWLLANGADRKSLLAAVGGGVVTDLAGFAACIYKRGIRYANYPTTLLCMVDAGIGGKTGANLDSYKNMVGIIRQPEYTSSDVSVLKTLPERELRSGAAEMLKTFILSSEEDYTSAVKVLSAPEMDWNSLGILIDKAASFKKEVVRQDPDEKDLRRILNLGHTYAHAIEWWQHSGNRCQPDTEAAFTHGEAVAIGMVKAAQMAEDLGIAQKGLSDKLAKDFKACGLPTQLPCPEEELKEAIRKDKKAEGGKVAFVLPERIGKVRIVML